MIITAYRNLKEEETYIKWFGGECEIVYDPRTNIYHIHIKNDDVGYCCFHVPGSTFRKYRANDILDFLSKEYLYMMFMHMH